MTVRSRYPLLSLQALSLLISICFVPSWAVAEVVGLPAVVPYAKDSNIRQAIKDECQLGEKMIKYIGKYSKKSAAVSETPKKGKYLDMRITHVHATGGGGYSGPKWMEVKGTLMTNGKAGPSFRAKRVTVAGGWGACSAASKCAKAISKDISRWLKKPVDGAALGDAR